MSDAALETETALREAALYRQMVHVLLEALHEKYRRENHGNVDR